MLTSRLLSPGRAKQARGEGSMADALEMDSSDLLPPGERPGDISFLSKVDSWSWASFIAPSDNMLQKSSGFSSLDYDTIYNDGELHYLDKRKLGRSVWGFTGTTFIRWFIFVFIGVITGALGRFMEVSIEYIHKGRNLAFDSSHASSFDTSAPGFYLKLLFWNLMLAAVGSLLVVVVEPAAAGSGIDHVITYLNGIHVPNLFRFRTVFVKLFGTMVTVSASLISGPEGPMILIGSSIASAFTRGLKVVSCFRGKFVIGTNLMSRFHNDRDRRDFISAGAAAGLATAFGTPVGAVLFALEEASSYWNPSLTWRCFLCTSSACLVFSILQPPYNIIATRGLLSFKSKSSEIDTNSTYMTTVACFVIGVAGGLFGAFFNIVANKIAKLRATRKFYRLLEVLFLTFISTTIPFWVSSAMPVSAKCVNISFGSNEGLTQPEYNARALMDCPVNQTNLVNAIFFDNRDTALARLFTMRVDEFPAHSSALVSGFFFVGMILTYGVALPTGLFMPSVLIGVTFGRVAAYVYYLLTGIDATYLFAIAGAAAFLCGIQRNALSIVVIMMEATQTASFVLPIIVSSAVAKWVGDRFSHSLNHTSMHRRGVPFLEPTITWKADITPVSSAMSSDVVALPTLISLKDLISKLNACTHSGFPVVRPINGADRYVGLILRRQLRIILAMKRIEFRSGFDIPDFDTKVFIAMKDAHRSKELNVEAHVRGTFTEPFVDQQINLTPFMNRCAFSLHSNVVLSRAYTLFRTMGLRHLPIVDECNCVVGMITRSDLLKPIQLPPPSSSSYLEKSFDDARRDWDSGLQTTLNEALTRDSVTIREIF